MLSVVSPRVGSFYPADSVRRSRHLLGPLRPAQSGPELSVVASPQSQVIWCKCLAIDALTKSPYYASLVANVPLSVD